MANERSLTNGCYVVTAPDGTIFIESSEIRALRKAVAIGGTNEFVRWGMAPGDTTEAQAPASKPKAAKPAAAPAPVANITEGAAVPASDF